MAYPFIVRLNIPLSTFYICIFCFCSASGKILGESIETQKSARFGGVIPSFAMGFHAESLPRVLDRVIEQATGVRGNGTDRLQDNGVEVIAVTTKPGLSGSLSVGSGFAKFLCRKNKLPMIPIHHMEAHALTARMQHEVQHNVLLATKRACPIYVEIGPNKL